LMKCSVAQPKVFARSNTPPQAIFVVKKRSSLLY
jgi:hypothetical protein